MSIIYTNRKGVTYHLCRGVTKTGKPRYYFAREPKGEVLDEVPPGFKISESVNGVVSLIKDRPSPLWPEEVAAVEAEVRRHPKARNYRVGAKGDRIVVYERVGPDTHDLLTEFMHLGPFSPGQVKELQEMLDRHADSRRCCASSLPMQDSARFARSAGVTWAASTTGSTSGSGNR
jgi:hypothetical protein